MRVSILCYSFFPLLALANAAWEYAPPSAVRHMSTFQHGMGKWMKYAVGVGAIGAVGIGARRARSSRLLPTGNATDFDQRLSLLEQDTEKIREVVKKVYKNHNEELSRLRTLIDDIQQQNSTSEERLAALTETVGVLDSSLRAMKNQMEDGIIEVEGRVTSSMQQIQSQMQAEQDVIHEEVHEMKSLLPELQSKINEQVILKLKQHSEELLSSLQKQFES